MKIFIASDLRAAVCDDRIYLASQHYSIIKRYCDAFGKCILCSRRVPKDNTQVWIDATDIIEKHIKVDLLRKKAENALRKSWAMLGMDIGIMVSLVN